MAGIPGVKKTRFYEKKGWVEAIGVGPPIIAAIIGAVTNIADPSPTKHKLGWGLLLGAGWLGASSVVKVLNAKSQDKKQEDEQNYEGLLGALHVIYGALREQCNIADTERGRLRITIHRVVPAEDSNQSPQELEQLLPYLGGDGKGAGRKFSIRSGIIGKAARERSAFALQRANDDYEAFVKELIAVWTYPEADARKLTSDRQAWMAVPIFGSQSQVLGVVFLDSNQRDFFTDPVQETVLRACSGLAAYIKERYK